MLVYSGSGNAELRVSVGQRCKRSFIGARWDETAKELS